MYRSLQLALCALFLGVVGCGNNTATDAGMTLADVGGGDDAGTDAGSVIDDAGTDGGSDGGTVVDVGPMDAGPTNRCTNAADMPITEMPSTPNAVASCGQSTFGAEPGLMNCITTMTGLSAPCASCYDGEVQCVIAHCLGAGCATDPGGASCNSCRIAMCHPAFMSCSGLS